MDNIKAIRNDSDYRAALSMLESLIDQNPEADTEEADRLEVLSILIDKYETEFYPSELPTALDAIQFTMDQKDLKPVDLAPFLGSKSRVSEILAGKRALTVDMIRALEKGLGIPSTILLRKSETNETSALSNWDKKLLHEMEARNYFGDQVDIGDKRSLLAKFFSSNTPNTSVAALLRQSSFRSAPTTDNNALLAWSTKVLNDAKKVKVKTKFQAGTVDLSFMTELTKLSVHADGVSRVKSKLESIGIILIIEPHLPKTRLDGAVLALDGHPVIGITLRHDRLDNFWFTLMHELAHISLHFDKLEIDTFFDELEDSKGMELSLLEVEADKLAGEALIPDAKWAISPAKLIPSPLAAKSLANELGIDISIVAGKIRYESGNWSYLSGIISSKKVSENFGIKKEES